MKIAMPETAGWVRLRSKENIWLLNVSGTKGKCTCRAVPAAESGCYGESGIVIPILAAFEEDRVR
jgi:hypothetical protein